MKEVGFLYKARGGETGSSADRFALGDWDPDRPRAGLRHRRFSSHVRKPCPGHDVWTISSMGLAKGILL